MNNGLVCRKYAYSISKPQNLNPLVNQFTNMNLPACSRSPSYAVVQSTILIACLLENGLGTKEERGLVSSVRAIVPLRLTSPYLKVKLNVRLLLLPP